VPVQEEVEEDPNNSILSHEVSTKCLQDRVADNNFIDIEGHWAENFIDQVYRY